MSNMDQYEYRRENLREDGFKDDPIFDYGKSPTSKKVVSFFCKRKANDPEVILPEEYFEKEVDYDIMVNVDWCHFHLKRVLRGKRKFYGDADLYRYVVLQDYITQCKKGEYTKCLLSSAEFMILKPKKKK